MVCQGDGKQMSDYPEDKQQEQPLPAPDNGHAAADHDAVVEQYDETLKPLTPGDIVEGRVVHIGGDEVLVDVGYKSEGRIPISQLGLRPGQTPADVLQVDDSIAVQVMRVDEGEGTVVLSKRLADERQAWEELTAKFEAGEPVEAEVTARVKGGLLVDLGVRGFVPASHVDRTFVDNLEQYVGQRLRFRILELDRQRRNVVLSRKELLEEELAKAKAEAFAQLEEGQVVSGVVRRLTDFGAFVDIGLKEAGLVHVSELADKYVKHPLEVVKVGDNISVRVIGVDQRRHRIALSCKSVN